MKTIIKKRSWFTVITILCLVVTLFIANSCDKSDVLPETDDGVSFTPCQPSKLRNSEFSDKVDVGFTNKGVKITYYDFVVTCDFTTVNVTHTFVNGILHITQQGTPNQANCICYTDVSYSIDGISRDKVNAIYINGERVYSYTLQGTKWKLIEVSIPTDYQRFETFDCSERNVIYEFQENNKLVITGNVNDLFIFHDFQEGEHFYEYNEPHVCPLCVPAPNLAIDKPGFGAKGRHYCLVDLDNKTMRINGNGEIIEGIYQGFGMFFIKLD